MTADALLPVGRDCDCGHPLVWRHGHPYCAVYGSHPVIVSRYEPSAPFRELVRLCQAATDEDRRARRARRHLKAVS